MAVTNALGQVSVTNLFAIMCAKRVKRTLPLGQVETYAYDLAGNLTNKVDFNGHSTVYAYDTMNRLLSKTPDEFFAAPAVTFSYTAAGQRATMSDASGLTTYGYDLRDRLLTKATPQGTLVYSNDAVGNVTFIGSLNTNGISLSYTYDALNRLERVTDSHTGTTAYGYDAPGNLTGCTYPNGITNGYTYDSLNRLTNLSAFDAQQSPVAWYGYTIAPSGHRLSAAENVAITNGVQTINRIYSYDATYRLTGESFSVSGPVSLPDSANVGYTLDDVGNRLYRTSTLPGVGGQVLTYDSNDRLNRDSYDANGNTTLWHIEESVPAVSDAYDFEDRLINRNNGQVLINYDGDGNRVSKTVGGVTTLFLVDDRNPTGYAQVLEELTVVAGSPIVSRVYAYGSDLISQDQLLDDGQGGVVWTTTFYGYDGHGNVRYLTGASGDVIDTYDYDAFGTLIARTGGTPNNYLYCGEQFDEDLDLYYNRARYLNTDSGRFWTRDVFEGIPSDALSLQEYLYAKAEPVNSVDPSGYATVNETLQSLGINAQVRKSVGQLVKRKTIRKLQGFFCQELKDRTVQGIYGIVLADGTFYIGQSKDIARRLKEWEREGARFVGALETVTGMKKERGQKFIRELIEQAAINLKGGTGGGQINNAINENNLEARLKRHDPVNKMATEAFKLIPICKEIKE